MNIESNRTFTTGEIPIKFHAIVFNPVLLECDGRANFPSRTIVHCTSAIVLEYCVRNVVLHVALCEYVTSVII